MSPEDAYHIIHDQLALMPIAYCYWKETTDTGVVSKNLSSYRTSFYFVKDTELKNSISELRFCLDYYRSLYKLHRPGLTFGWHHKLVTYQIIGAIYEGLMLDLVTFISITANSNGLTKALWKNRISLLGLGQLNEYLFQSGIYDEEWKVYINNIKHARDTVHPKSLNSQKAHFRNNPVVRSGVDDAVNKLDSFISLTKRSYSYGLA